MAADVEMTGIEPGDNTMTGKLPVLVLSLGVGLGFLADQLFGSVGPFGLGFFLWTLLYAVTLCWLGIAFSTARPQVLIGWSLCAFAAVTMILFRTTPVVILSLLLVMVVAMAMIILHLGRCSLNGSTFFQHLRALVMVPWQSVSGAPGVLSRVDLSAGFRSPKAWSLLRGLLLATPLLLIFASLFSAADAGFSRLFSNIVELVSERTLQHLVLTAVFAWLSTGLLAGIAGNRYFDSPVRRLPFLKLGTEDTAVLMGSLAALFLIFVFLQLGYLFGGRETIEATSGLTLAQYARRGFFELLLVAGLTLGLLIVVAGSGCNQRVFRPLATVLLACVLIIQLSAVQRLLLYIDSFGLTIDRLTALAVMAWLTIGLMLFAATLLRGQPRRFAAGMTISGVTVVLLLALSNPAAIVTRINLRTTDIQPPALDIDYLLGLGPDAVPPLVKRFDGLTLEPRHCIAVAQIYSRWYRNPSAVENDGQGWRGWNYSQRHARVLIADFEDRLRELAQPCAGAGQLVYPRELSQELNTPVVWVGVSPAILEQMFRWLRDTP
ncbi:MAG: DUF4173 domain-containing protein [Gammaproteobacteria bacterium]|nr:DUF4173 domain-containing protein [Pseudomonadales bacterium]